VTKPPLRYRLAAAVGGRVLDTLFATARFHDEGADHYRVHVDAGEPVIFVLWHGRLLPLAYHHRGQGLVTLVSRSADGEYIAGVLRHWGYGAVRGSSSRGGGPALRELVRLVRSGRSICVTADGPRGPRERIKPGALLAAQLTGRPLIPAAAGTGRAWWFEGWDRFLVPKPFASIRVAYGEPVFVQRKGGQHALDEAAGALEATMGTLMRTVDAD